MKLTETVIELMYELSSIEGVKHVQYLDGDGDGVKLRNNLLKLFNKTKNPAAHDIIIDIMSEAGYPWFGTLARSDGPGTANISAIPTSNLAENQFMSDDEFMELLPANGRIH